MPVYLSLISTVLLVVACGRSGNPNAPSLNSHAEAPKSFCQKYIDYYNLGNVMPKIYPGYDQIEIPVKEGGYAGFCHNAPLTGLRTQRVEVPQVVKDTCVMTPSGRRGRGSSGGQHNLCSPESEKIMEQYTWLEINDAGQVADTFPANGYFWLKAGRRYELELVIDFSKNPHLAHCDDYHGMHTLAIAKDWQMPACPAN